MVQSVRSNALAIDGLVGAAVALPEVRLICPCRRSARPDAEAGAIAYAINDAPDPDRTFHRWSWHEVVAGRNMDFLADMRRDMAYVEAFGDRTPDEVHRFTCHRCGKFYDVSVSALVALALAHPERTKIVKFVLGTDL